MADLDYDGFGSGADGEAHFALGGAFSRAAGIAGALMSVVLIAGLAVWGYKLLVRDVTGIPVVRAIEGPMRVQPDDPGGDRAAHQGLAVNRIAAVGEAAPPPEEIVLAPRSSDLEAEDVAQGLLRTAPALAAAPRPTAPAEALPAAEPEAVVEPAVARSEDLPLDPLEAAILAATTQVLEAEAELSGEGLIDAIPSSVAGVARSLRPRARPDGLRLVAAAPAAAPEAAPAPAAPEVVDPATLEPGTRLVQFGAFPSSDEAAAAWTALAGRFGPLMEGKGQVVEEAATGGRTIFRLRAAGFDDLADARRFCAALVAEEAECIPVLAR